MEAQAITDCRECIYEVCWRKIEMLRWIENGRKMLQKRDPLLIYVKPTTQHTSSINWVLNLICLFSLWEVLYYSLHLIGFYGEGCQSKKFKPIRFAVSCFFAHESGGVDVKNLQFPKEEKNRPSPKLSDNNQEVFHNVLRDREIMYIFTYYFSHVWLCHLILFYLTSSLSRN